MHHLRLYYVWIKGDLYDSWNLGESGFPILDSFPGPVLAITLFREMVCLLSHPGCSPIYTNLTHYY